MGKKNLRINVEDIPGDLDTLPEDTLIVLDEKSMGDDEEFFERWEAEHLIED